jgi:GNAT superfamily N-acetyltransferase
VPVEVTLPLRRRLLRVDRPDLPLRFPEDYVRHAFGLGAFHLASFVGGEPIGVVSVAPSEPGFEVVRPCYRLYQMAVDPGLQRRGVGTSLYRTVVERLHARAAATLWAEARRSSLEFYLRQGMVPVADREHQAGGVDYCDVVADLRLIRDR